MPVRPPLPDDVDLPETVNGWVYDPENGMNGHVWTAPDGTAAVGVFSSAGASYARALDERVEGFARAIKFAEHEYDASGLSVDESRAAKADATATVLDEAVDWMEANGPEWEHDDVCGDALTPPPGYELDNYYLEDRETTVFYHLADGDEPSILFDDAPDGEVTAESHPYLRIHVWNGSGNADIALAPWPTSHDHNCEPIVEDLPDECGLGVAVEHAREWARANVDGAGESSVTAGQSDLSTFGEVTN